MPYIEQYRREILDQHHHLNDTESKTVGELNYVITKLCKNFCSTPNYTRINEIIGVLECAKQEFYRRLAASYEDKKIEENGDVYKS